MSVVVAKRYAKSIFDLAKEKQMLEELYKDANVLINIFTKSEQANSLLLNPVLSFFKKKEIFKKVFDGKLNSFTLSCFYFILKQKRATNLVRILKEYNVLYRFKKNIRYVDLVTAKNASEDLKGAIIESLGQEKKVLLNVKVDPKILGGMLIRVGDKQYDSTVKNSINKIKSSFKI